MYRQPSVAAQLIDTISHFGDHMITCRQCTRTDGTYATLRGCSAGHYLAVKAAVALRQLQTADILRGHYLDGGNS